MSTRKFVENFSAATAAILTGIIVYSSFRIMVSLELSLVKHIHFRFNLKGLSSSDIRICCL